MLRPACACVQVEGRLLHLSHEALLYTARVIALSPARYAAFNSADSHAALARLLARAYPHALMGLEPPELAGIAAAYEHAKLPWLAAGNVTSSLDASSLIAASHVPTSVTASAAASSARAMGGTPPPKAEFHRHECGDPPDRSRSRDRAEPGAVGVGGAAWVGTAALQQCLEELCADHVAGRDLCIVGGAGGGKSALVEQLASVLGYETMRVVPLYRDLTSSDLLQRRTLDESGNTGWAESPVVTAARAGDLCILDGLHQLRPDGLTTLSSLILDREAVLHDGTRLMRAEHYDELRASLGASDVEMAERALLRVHPSFRIVATALPPTATHRWLSSDVLPLFAWHELRAPSPADLARILAAAPAVLAPVANDVLLRISAALDTAAGSGSQHTSLPGGSSGSGGSGGSCGASRGGESGAAASGRRRAAAARRGATRPSSGLQLSMRWLGRRQRSPAYVWRPCRCSALVCAPMCSCSVGARIAGVVCACVCAGMQPEAARWAPTRPRAAEQATSRRYLMRVQMKNITLIFSSSQGSYSRDGHRVQHRNT